MTFANVLAKLPLPRNPLDADHEWIVLLDCGHEVRLLGRKGKRPARGARAVCAKCSEDSGVRA